MFTVILAVVALTDYVIILYFIVNMVAKPTVETEEPPKDISGGGVIRHINSDKELNDYIEEQNARIAVLSFNVDEILSNIDSIIERKKVNQGALAG
jgi:hypothetical protein